MMTDMIIASMSLLLWTDFIGPNTFTYVSLGPGGILTYAIA